tara:strand:- start:828 stop:1601 length:774 start_codon:yes stop_codon:yes gene_type:complete
MFNEALEEDPPKVGKPAPTTVKLMCGLQNPSTGEWQDQATVAEMTGEDEEELDRLTTKDNLSYADYTSALLRRAVTSIGDTTVADDSSVLDNLIIGDRDLLFMGVIRATYGNIRSFSVVCPKCEEKNEVKVNLDTDFEMDQPKSDPRETRTITLRNGDTVDIKYLTGGDASSIASSGSTPAVQNTEIVVHSVVWGDDRSLAVRRQWAKSLSLADRKVIVNAVLDDQPGPRLEEVNAPCAYCSENIAMVLDWVSLLFG